jgi:Xaa-Pro aminopeptidase
MAIEPILDMPGMHIRIEDSVLVTPTGAEILSTAVPKEAEDLMALLRQSGRSN